MLQNLHVKNLALIDEIEVEFKEGLNILTGETGAGKSIILGSMNLALGGRYHKDILREGAAYGLVELSFMLRNQSQIEQLRRMDIFPEEGVIVLSRRLMEGRSVSRINGETVPIGTLKEVASILIDIHGQHEHQSLLYKKNHIEILDSFAGELLFAVREEAAMSYKEYRRCEKALKEADKDDAQRAKELAFLKFEVNEIEEASLQVGEDEELELRYRRMSNIKQIASSIQEAYGVTSEDQHNASSLLSHAIRAMSEAARYDESAEKLCDQLIEVDSLLNDFNRELADYSADCEYSEEEFLEIETRLNEMNHLKQKYGSSLEAVLNYQEEQTKKITVLENHEMHIESLKAELNKMQKEYDLQAQSLSKIRKAQAKILEKAIQKGLKELNFSEVQFQITFEQTQTCSERGIDDVEFMISLNLGQPVKPLTQVASGGELSRIMLAIKTVMAKRDDIETLIFDEIDVGISGRTAQKVSEKMAVIGKLHQVICITHLAQIAAMADAHYVIEKSITKKETKTQIYSLNEEESIKELARILGGAKITDAVIQNAVEMKELAKQTKQTK